MFDLGWSEILVVAVVAIIVVGPKDLPKLLRTVGQWVRRARSLASEFQRGMMDLADTADLKDLKDLKKDVEEVTNFDMAGPDFNKILEPPGKAKSSKTKDPAATNGVDKSTPKPQKSAKKTAQKTAKKAAQKTTKKSEKPKAAATPAKSKPKASKKAAETAS